MIIKETKIWKTIEIGTKKPNLDKDVKVSIWAKELLKIVTYPKKKNKIDLIILTPKDLGFTENPNTTELFDEKNLAKYGVELCPSEVGIFLINEYTDQPNGEWLYISHKPITDSNRSPGVFSVERDSDGKRWLDGYWANAGYQWDLGDRFVFRFRKSVNLETLNLRVSHSDIVSSVLAPETSVEARLSKMEQFMKDNFKGFV